MIAPSFADIFYGNSFNNQLLPVTLSDAQVDELFALVKANPGIKFEVDLEAQVVKAGDKTYSFKIDDFRRHCMLNGLDSIGLTLQHEDAIAAYEITTGIYAVTLHALPGLQVMQYHPVAIIFCRPDKRSAIKLRVTHQSLMPGIFRHFLYDFYSPGHHLRDHRNSRNKKSQQVLSAGG